MIKAYKNPPKNQWESLAKRATNQEQDITATVMQIFNAVKTEGDTALKKYTQKLDGVAITQFKIEEEQLAQARVSSALYKAMKLAATNIERFHSYQKIQRDPIETTPGVNCWLKDVPIEKIGLYIPGGTAPLFSTVLMLGIPARIAGCSEIIVCTPPQSDGQVDPAILVACRLVGVKSLYTVGGAQAIAAMTFGTASIPQVYKILGPGNQYVTRAKELATQFGMAIDMPAGPSELLVIADDASIPKYIAADLLSQAEHGSDSQVVLLSDNEKILIEVNKELALQITSLSRSEIALNALNNSFSVLFSSIAECINWSNYYAPEHLILAVKKADTHALNVINAGSVFLGNYSPESAGDYASGTNHTLPTSGFAKNQSGVNLSSFTKQISFQEIKPDGLNNIGPAIEQMAMAEGLDAHMNAVRIRLKDLANV